MEGKKGRRVAELRERARMYVGHVATGIASMCHRGNHAGNAEARRLARTPPPRLTVAAVVVSGASRALLPSCTRTGSSLLVPPPQTATCLSLPRVFLGALCVRCWCASALISSRARFVKSRNSLCLMPWRAHVPFLLLVVVFFAILQLGIRDHQDDGGAEFLLAQ